MDHHDREWRSESALLYEAEFQRELDRPLPSCLGSACCPECGVPRDGYLMLDGSWHRGCTCHERRSNVAKISRGRAWNYGCGAVKPGDIVGVTYVTVVGYAHDFAVYMGDSDQSVEEIAKVGDKVSEEVGRAVAPYCSHLRYRN